MLRPYFLFFFALLAASLPISEVIKFLPNVPMIGLLVLVVVDVLSASDKKALFRQTLQNYISDKTYLAMLGIFLLVLISGLWSSNIDYFLERLRIRLPFITVPFAMAHFGGLRPAERQIVLKVFSIATLLAGLSVLGMFLLHYEHSLWLLKHGKHVWTPSNPIRFSLMTTAAIFGSFWLWQSDKRWRRLWLGITGILVFLLHLMSIRSGIASFYIASFVLILLYIKNTKNIVLGLSMIVFLCAIPLIAYYSLPSIREKINYSKMDLIKHAEGDGKNYSDSQRIISYQIAIHLIKKHPVLGVGFGDAKDEIYQVYADEYSEMNPMLPHNQFLFIAVGTGILGVLLFLFFSFFPIFYQNRYTDSLYLSIQIVSILSFIPETTIETAIGTAFTVWGLMLYAKKIDATDYSTPL